MPALRNALVLLLAVMLGGAPLARSLGAPSAADCAVAQAAAPDEGCCGGSSPGVACVMGASACLPSVSQRLAAQFCLDAPSARLVSPLLSHARAPDTAPPKSSAA